MTPYLKLLLALTLLVKYSEPKLLLKQVVILSRHGLRTPTASDALPFISSPTKTWPVWKEKRGYLTVRGALLEGYMGEFFSAWLYEKRLLPNHCPNNEIFVYADTSQRTLASARAFVNKGFPNCNVTVHYSDKSPDPIFSHNIRNASSIFKQLAIKEMNNALNSLKLTKDYKVMQDILDYNQSAVCLIKLQCNLTSDKNEINDIEPGKKCGIKGPLRICNIADDGFFIEYYHGLPLEKVAWGELRGKIWRNIINLHKAYQSVIYTDIISKDISELLIRNLTSIFMNDGPKVSLLMGHDANLISMMKSLRFKPYTLHDQFQDTPFGGAVVFERWFSEKMKKDFLRIKYVYQSNAQFRSASKLSLDNPPMYAVLELEACKTDNFGFCPWNEFSGILRSLYN